MGERPACCNTLPYLLRGTPLFTVAIFTRKYTRDSMMDSSDPAPVSPTSIWSSRMPRELASLEEKLRRGTSTRTCRVTVLSKTLDNEKGVCKCTVMLNCRDEQADDHGPDEDEPLDLGETGGVLLEVDASSRPATGEGTGVSGATAYPFVPPIINIIQGIDLLPAAYVGEDGRTLLLAALRAWTPKVGLADLVLAAAEAVQGFGGAHDEDPETRGYEPNHVLDVRHLGDRLFPGSVPQQGGDMLPRYLVVTEDWVLNVKAHEAKLGSVVVVKARPQAHIGKLRYKQGCSISVEFRDGDRWLLAMPRAQECVEAIQEALRARGVVGSRTSQAALNHVARAQAYLQEAQRREEAAEEGGHWTLAQVRSVCDLYKQATERFGSVSSDESIARTGEAVGRLQSFLSRPDVQDLLARTASPTGAKPPDSDESPAPEGPGPLSSPPARKGEILAGSAVADMASGEDDGLSREERRLAPLSERLKHMLDLNLREPAADARDRLPSLDSTSSSSGTGGNSRTGAAVAGEGPAPMRAGGGMDAELHELDEALGEASREWEGLRSPGPVQTSEKPPAGSEEEEIVI